MPPSVSLASPLPPETVGKANQPSLSSLGAYGMFVTGNALINMSGGKITGATYLMDNTLMNLAGSTLATTVSSDRVL